MARFDSSRRSQHEGTTRAGPWRRQAAWRLDIAAMELWAQRHLGRHSGRHTGKRLGPICSRVPSPVPVPLRLQLSEKGTSAAHSAAPTTFTQWHWKHLDPWVSAPRSSWHKSEGVWPRWRRTPMKRRSFSSACRSPSNPSTRHAQMIRSQFPSPRRNHSGHNFRTVV